jgi:4-alpha-glucanotransferase
MILKRSAGVILHPTSLPGPDGIGDLGPEAYRWVNYLAETGCTLWQILPLGPTGYGDSPYQCFSAFAGNPYLVSPALLLDEELLTREDLADRPTFSANAVDFGPVIQWKLTLLDRAYAHYKETESELKTEVEKFQASEASWLNDFSLFMAIKEAQGGGSWVNWTKPLRQRDAAALADFSLNNQDAIQRQVFRQFLFFRQWSALREYTNKKGIAIIGDAPIFVSMDSADVWSHPDHFYLDEASQPTMVAGVPPDYFSTTGQLWGNPLYRWDFHKQTQYTWWIERIQATLKIFDYIRLDHFRGFAGYWEVPAGNPTAEKGQWKPGPGPDLFEAIRAALGGLPIIAEDLGEITPDVIALRDGLDLPGMKIFQFAFSNDEEDPFLPHNYPANCVAYTGTHDNDTAVGWYQAAPEHERDFFRRYTARSGDNVAWDMVRAVWSSVAAFALAPMQDMLSLDTQSRMNYPGKASGNWSWRVTAAALDEGLKARIKEQNTLYNRLPVSIKPVKTKKDTSGGYFL